MQLQELEAGLAARQTAELLQAALNILTERERVIVLCRQTRTVRDLASDLECPHVLVHNEYHAALLRMREYFASRGIAEFAQIF